MHSLQRALSVRTETALRHSPPLLVVVVSGPVLGPQFADHLFDSSAHLPSCGDGDDRASNLGQVKEWTEDVRDRIAPELDDVTNRDGS